MYVSEPDLILELTANLRGAAARSCTLLTVWDEHVTGVSYDKLSRRHDHCCAIDKKRQQCYQIAV